MYVCEALPVTILLSSVIIILSNIRNWVNLVLLDVYLIWHHWARGNIVRWRSHTTSSDMLINVNIATKRLILENKCWQFRLVYTQKSYRSCANFSKTCYFCPNLMFFQTCYPNLQKCDMLKRRNWVLTLFHWYSGLWVRSQRGLSRLGSLAAAFCWPQIQVGRWFLSSLKPSN